ncbi:MAG: hypothetical protein A2X08_01015 [Bacteroidetes bacterium GWA2_32_17]|nr:MAG: hypothetical protein A2X08_01015 [Bacteroidetes bacterium GWA2_32_17]
MESPDIRQDITYTPFNKVSSIIEGENELFFTYGTANQRVKTEYYDNDIQKIKYFAGNYEQEIINGNTRELHYIAGPMGLAAIYVKQGGNDTMYYTHTDHLGSITEITDNTGTLLQRMQYDAWGKRSFITNNIGIYNFLFARGYTGHEHLDQFALINMNGRLYDPVLGRMLSPDNYVQNSTNSQNFNRYSYCLNNPMVYNDPSGELWNVVIGAGVGALSYGVQTLITHQRFDLNNFAIAVGQGALGGLGSSSAKAVSVTGAIPGAIYGAASGALSSGLFSGVMAASQGQSFRSGFESGLLNGAISGGITGGISGYASAKEQGRNVWTGGQLYDKGKDFRFFTPPQKRDEVTCVFYTATQADESPYGLGRPYLVLKNGYGIELESNGVDPEIALPELGFDITKSKGVKDSYNFIERTGMPVTYSTTTHTMIVNRIEKWSSGFFNIPFYKIYTSSSGPDPYAGQYIRQIYLPGDRMLLINSISPP